MENSELSVLVERIKVNLSYDKGTGEFTWLVDRGGKARAGTRAGSLNKAGYVNIFFDGRQYSGHRLAWLLSYGDWPEEEVDHINRDRSDNRLINLRSVNRYLNCANMGMRKANTSGYKNVHWDQRRNKWLAHIRRRGHLKHLGYFEDIQDAVKAVEQYMVREAPEGIPVMWRAPIAT